jgi:hypothetical protein
VIDNGIQKMYEIKGQKKEEKLSIEKGNDTKKKPELTLL